MGEDPEEIRLAVKRVEPYAQAIARNILQEFGLGHDDAWHEDITQSLLLAGYQVWRDTGDEAKARHRMSTRAVNEKKKLFSALKQPRPSANPDLPEPSSEPGEGIDYTEHYQAESPGVPYRRMRNGPVVRSSPGEDLAVKEYLEGLPERPRKILHCRMAMMTTPAIAKELGISPRTVERELEQIRKDYKDEHAE